MSVLLLKLVFFVVPFTMNRRCVRDSKQIRQLWQFGEYVRCHTGIFVAAKHERIQMHGFWNELAVEELFHFSFVLVFFGMNNTLIYLFILRKRNLVNNKIKLGKIQAKQIKCKNSTHNSVEIQYKSSFSISFEILHLTLLHCSIGHQ